MITFLREHLVLALILAYTLGQITAVLVLGGLVPRDTGGMGEQLPSHGSMRVPRRRRVSRRFSFGTPTRAAVRTSGAFRLRRFLDRESTVGMN